jgi:plastocyanin
MMSESSTQTADATSSVEYSSTATYTSETSTMTYGSGSNNWGGSGYNDCVQQCIASYGAPPGTWTPSSTQGSNDGSYQGSTGTGATHTVVVAPSQGVLRYVPFAVNASVGDTVMFVWGAKNHTVTKSSSLELCNKTTAEPFASGTHDAPFTFTQVVNDTNPTFFYCGTPGHCQKGMFGMINPPSAYATAASVSQMMPAAVSNSSDMAAMMAYTNTLTAGNDKAASWGSNIDLAQLPEWAHASALENVMYTRSFLGANPETLKDNGLIDMSDDTPKTIPEDMASVNNAVDSTGSASQTPSAPSPVPSAPSGGAAGSTKDNGVASTAASTAFLGVAAFAVAVLAF